MFDKFTIFKHLAEKILTNDRSSKGLLIVTTTLNVLCWRIGDDLLNSPNFLPAKLSHYTVYRVRFHAPSCIAAPLRCN